MRKSYHIGLILLIGSYSCGLMPGFKLNKLYRQRIANSRKVIYDFEFSPAFVTEGEWMGKVILDSTEKFPTTVHTRKGIDELPCCFIQGRLGAENMTMLGIVYGQAAEGDTLLSPISHTQEMHSGVKVDLTRYKETYGTAINIGLQEYKFESLVETSDRLVFKGVTNIFGAPLPDTAAFNKGNIKVVDSTNGNINFIEISAIVVGRGDIYKPGKPFEVVHHRPVVGERIYQFYPKQATPASRLSDYGIYKEVK